MLRRKGDLKRVIGAVAPVDGRRQRSVQSHKVVQTPYGLGGTLIAHGIDLTICDAGGVVTTLITTALAPSP